MAYSVPAGFRAVLKTITVVWGDITISGLDTWLMDDGLCKICRKTWFTTYGHLTEQGGTELWYGSWVFDEGENIWAQTVEGTVDWHSSGYLLTL